MRIVVTGATGHLGRLVIEGLLEKVPADRIVAVVRDPAKATALTARGIRLHTADYSEPHTLQGAFTAGDRVLLISGSEVGRRVPQHRAVIDAAREAGVALLAYTSVLGAPTADFALAEEHQATERALTASGVPYVLLRNGWYHENYTENLAPVLEYGAVVGAAGEGRVASASRADYAAAAVAVLTGEGHAGRAYELSGDTAWSLAEYAAMIAERTGREIVYNPVSPDAYQSVLTGAGLPGPVAEILADSDTAVARGRLAATSGELSRLIGRPATPLAEAVAVALHDLKGITGTTR
ncbi:SDR family oxidoreductase [Streptomyces coffeae]|uniref:SDR family oxidoreductase n=1 Tax=Streptomyces coffeae TaxID=621382 RepID=A0ABS1NRS1_9ACTN|nr:SDR family oxidoreductase [Streptomyces coffeae]MBL1102520.1 SDR family oxidoreductase [Streptomyces coffeae]